MSMEHPETPVGKPRFRRSYWNNIRVVTGAFSSDLRSQRRTSVVDVPRSSNQTDLVKARTNAEVGAAVKRRRMELKKDRVELAREADVDDKTLASLESGERWPRDRSRARIEAALLWRPGSLAAIRSGGDPVQVDSVPSAPKAAPDPPADDRENHVPDFLEVAKLTWMAVNDLAESPEGDELRQWKADRLLVVAADTLTDALLRLHIGAPARQLIQEMNYKSHEIVKQYPPPFTQPAAAQSVPFDAKKKGASPDDGESRSATQIDIAFAEGIAEFEVDDVGNDPKKSSRP